MGIARSQMNRQLYQNGTGIAELLKMQQDNANEALTEEQLQANLPIDLQATFKQLIETGLSPEEARKAIGEQLKQISMAARDYSSYQPQLLSPGEEMGNVFISQPNPEGYARGGIAELRQGYGLGSIVKGITKGITGAVKGAVGAVKDIASSPIGKMALLAAGGYYAPTLWGASPGLAGWKSGIGLLGNVAKSAIGGGIGDLVSGKTLAALGLGMLGGALASPQKIQEAYRRNPEATKQYLRKYYSNVNPNATEEEINEFVQKNIAEYATGGRVQYAMGSMPMGQPRQNQGGIMELDYRNTGGFVPVGIKEKADDVPAMLSKNEFVFTADAVRNAGNGDVDLGAQRLYNQMKTLENGGVV